MDWFDLPKWILVICGLFLLGWAIAFPVLMNSLREHDGALFGPGPNSVQDALASVTTTVSLVSSIGVAAVAVIFERSRNKASSLLLGVVTLLIFTIEIMYTFYASVLRPWTGRVPTYVDLDIVLGLIPVGLAFTMFTLASVIRN